MAGRATIPADVRRGILIEASYRCAVPRCLTAIAIDVHHIDENASNNDPSNLIALCPTCHAAFHRKTYSVDAIKFWKLMLQQFNAAYDRNSINLLFMLEYFESCSWNEFEVTGDGFLAFSPLLSSRMINVTIIQRYTYGRPLPYYQVRLSDKGRATMQAWQEGDPSALPQTDDASAPKPTGGTA